MTTQTKPQPDAAAPVAASLRPAGPARIRPRHIIVMVSFLVCVVLPALVTAWYLYTRAADQYASKVGFTVRQEEAGSAMELLGGLSSLSSASSSDIDILYEFIQSQELVRAIDEKMNLTEIYSKPENDPIYRLAPDASIEDKVDYWERMVRLYFTSGNGLIEVEVRAFDPQDAYAIAQQIFEESSAMINELSSIARADATLYAREELDEAVERLKQARSALTRFRNETQVVDPAIDIQSQMGVLSSLQAQLAESLIDEDLQQATNDPRIAQTRRRIEVIERRIADERQKLGGRAGADNANSGPGTEDYADLFGTFESLAVDTKFAEEAYISALSAYNSAVAEARRQSRYLAAYLRPTLPETPRYPDRTMVMLIITLILMGVWTILVLIGYSLKDRR
ncbi:capsule biosynthesis protein [Sulfitobacter sp. HNIBRBA3233]|uniref:capsule biosynthesis protein n=1 Tax=Sulfitobacter marinivivus TaxID=3158558 RepID=UPI0032DF0C43